jgi:hypothetical protein
MLWGYAMPNPGEENWKVLWRKPLTATQQDQVGAGVPAHTLEASTAEHSQNVEEIQPAPEQYTAEKVDSTEPEEKLTEQDDDMDKSPDVEKAQETLSPLKQPAKAELYSELSIALTLISILVAFAISLIEFMGIALEKCAKCADAAENSNGLDGKWWRFWGSCNDSSGYIGAGIVGVMLLCTVAFVLMRRQRRRKASREVAGLDRSRA